MRKGWLLVVVMWWGCSLLEAQSPEDLRCRRPELVVPPEGPVAYAFICLDGRPWRPNSARGMIELRPPEAFGPGTLPPPYLMLEFVLRDPTPALPFYEAKLTLDVWARPPRVDTTYYLFNTDPYLRKFVAQGRWPESSLGRMGSFGESEGDVRLTNYWIAREDSLRSWVRFSRIDTVQTEPFLLVFYEGRFEVVVSPVGWDPGWSRYPNAKLHFQGRFRVPVVLWETVYRCWREGKDCLRVEVRTL
ncbi:hypothetical protein [Rhodothermus profundi]|uniref:Uncharacterized protein n=1 Tax=Rhodothermus profundi TaxID=633813 RepID=A0A1M6QF03_9BACT|nr:hypothetical protein [Rhodothermus profundi]SHK18776.1 hypothetical protein SAMN04488087_0593 [Rhodothermus profundi]